MTETSNRHGAAKLTGFPERVVHLGRARASFGDLPTKMRPFFFDGDPAADEAARALGRMAGPERIELVDRALRIRSGDALPLRDIEETCQPLAELIREARGVPSWVNWERVDRAGKVLRRAGILGGLTLGLRCLVFGYAAPAGNKPLAWSGQLAAKADRRLAETGRFVADVCAPGSMHPGQLGFFTTLRVRLMHSQVRLLIEERGSWPTARFGVPINQHDMLATILLFSRVFVDGIRMMGVTVRSDEADDFQHLWRWVGWVIGVSPQLLPSSYEEAGRLIDFVHMTQAPPDDDSKRLVMALLEGPLRAARTPRQRRRAQAHVRMAAGMCRSLVGEELADQLELPRSPARFAVPVVSSALTVLEALRRRLPGIDPVVDDIGRRYWELTVDRGLAGVPAAFAMPERLQGAPARGARSQPV